MSRQTPFFSTFNHVLPKSRASDSSFQDTLDFISPSSNRVDCNWRSKVIHTLLAAVILSIGIIIGHFGISFECPLLSKRVLHVASEFLQDAPVEIALKLQQAIDSEEIRENLKYLTKRVHRAGTPENKFIADWIYNKFKQTGVFDQIETPTYDVLLAYPNPTNPDVVQIRNRTGNVLVNISDGFSPYAEGVEDELNSPFANQRFVAYSQSGSAASSKVYYANYGREEDFDYLLNTLQISLNGSIVLIRYGMLWRGAKVKLAQMLGAVGVLLYSDPADYANGHLNDTFPHSVYMPPGGVQRGTISFDRSQVAGDKLTPFFPAKNYVMRKTIEEIQRQGEISEIPVTPIGYGDAAKLLEALGGIDAPPDWRGSLNIRYRIGPLKESLNAELHINVGTFMEVRQIKNVIGFIRGKTEPDKWVLLGNHHDAWTYGGQDPDSGISVLLAIAAAYASVIKETGWRPRRTIVFCSWDAEEYGLVGSQEWVEENFYQLESQAVAYINSDIAVEDNTTFWSDSAPLLHDAIFNATKFVKNPNEAEILLGRHTVYDTWRHYEPNNITQLPKVGDLGSGSDFVGFMEYVGVSSADLRYRSSARRAGGGYPLYHTVYETFFLVDQIVDRGFKFHRALAQVWAEVVRNLADSLILPMNPVQYGEKLSQSVHQIATLINKRIPEELEIADHAKWLVQAANDFVIAAKKFHNFVNNNLTVNVREADVRIVNHKLQHLERTFIIPGGIPERPEIRHVVFAPSVHNSYLGVSFAGISDSIERMQRHQFNKFVVNSAGVDQRSRQYWKGMLRTQLNWAIYCLNSATKMLDCQSGF